MRNAVVISQMIIENHLICFQSWYVHNVSSDGLHFIRVQIENTSIFLLKSGALKLLCVPSSSYVKLTGVLLQHMLRPKVQGFKFQCFLNQNPHKL